MPFVPRSKSLSGLITNAPLIFKVLPEGILISFTPLAAVLEILKLLNTFSPEFCEKFKAMGAERVPEPDTVKFEVLEPINLPMVVMVGAVSVSVFPLRLKLDEALLNIS